MSLRRAPRSEHLSDRGTRVPVYGLAGHPLFSDRRLLTVALCPRCARAVSPVEMIQVRITVWRCLWCVEQGRKSA